MKISSKSSTAETDNTKVSAQISPSKHWLFTLNNYLPEEITILIESLVPMGKYVAQLETGEEGTKHLQGYISFNRKCRPLSLNLNNKIHWDKVKNSLADRTRAQEYCCDKLKRDPETPLYSNYMEDVIVEPIYGWQLELEKICLNKPEKRIFHWWYSTKYGVGKSDFVRYMMYHHDAVEVDINKLQDINCMIVAFRENKGYYPKIFIHDLPREENSFNIDFKNIEKFKGGKFFSSKYHSCSVVMNYPTLVILANHPVDSENSFMYGDRIIEVCIDKLI